MRASSRRSSTSSPIRAPSDSIRSINRRTSSSDRTAPCRYSSAKPRMEVSGVRSSWLASATKRRMRFSDPRACSSDACWARNAASMRDSILFSEVDSRPTSVRSLPSGTRRDRSPAAMARAVASTSPSGRKLLRTSRYPAAPRMVTTINPTIASMETSRRMAAWSRSMFVATTIVYPSGTRAVMTRQSVRPSTETTVCGRGDNESSRSGRFPLSSGPCTAVTDSSPGRTQPR